MPGLANLHQEFPILCELQDHVVVEAWKTLRSRAAAARGLVIAAAHRAPRALGTPSISADPDVALVVNRDSMIRIRPVVAIARTAPMADQVAVFIELENGWSRRAALSRGWIRCGVPLAGFE